MYDSAENCDTDCVYDVDREKNSLEIKMHEKRMARLEKRKQVMTKQILIHFSYL